MNCPYVELRLAREDRLHELEPARVFSERERRDEPGGDDVVSTHSVGSRGEGIHHASVSGRTDKFLSGHLRRQVHREVGLVPDHPVPDARQAFEHAAVARRNRGAELTQVARTHLLAPRPGRSGEDVHERRQAIRDCEGDLPVG
jgi:hypothetical protein